jgi:pimeloyl-ACP methyl ester carboxylesterase
VGGVGERRRALRHVAGPDALVDDLVDHLFYEDLTEVVLVGHSFGGLAISGAADRVPERIGHLVYLDSLVVESGESGLDGVAPEVAAERRRVVAEESDGYAWPAFPVSGYGVPEDHPHAAWMRERLTPQPFASYEQPLTLRNPVGNGLPATYVVCSDPLYPTLQASRDRATSYGWAMRELATGHDAMVLAPDDLAGLLVEVADGAAGRGAA